MPTIGVSHGSALYKIILINYNLKYVEYATNITLANLITYS